MYLLFVRSPGPCQPWMLRALALSVPEALAVAIELRKQYGAEAVKVDYARGWKLCG
jgi:hypothetical protein